MDFRTGGTTDRPLSSDVDEGQISMPGIAPQVSFDPDTCFSKPSLANCSGLLLLGVGTLLLIKLVKK